MAALKAPPVRIFLALPIRLSQVATGGAGTLSKIDSDAFSFKKLFAWATPPLGRGRLRPLALPPATFAAAIRNGCFTVAP